MMITNISRLKKNVFSIQERTNASLLKYHIYTRIYTFLILKPRLKHNYVNILIGKLNYWNMIEPDNPYISENKKMLYKYLQ